ncbi:hypothetical protein DL96DRAFT_1684305 [Flagelloscypha sp. PMI_526]|nr:hypothetical protein DL96DRAFT_1684305 [Flagelloscypha sp. PMI_526]
MFDALRNTIISFTTSSSPTKTSAPRLSLRKPSTSSSYNEHVRASTASGRALSITTSTASTAVIESTNTIGPADSPNNQESQLAETLKALDAERATVTRLQQENISLGRKNLSLERENLSLSRQSASFEGNSATLELSVRELRDKLHESELLVDSLSSQVQSLEHAQKQLVTSKARIRELEASLASAQRLVEVKTQELLSAKEFLTVADDASVADARRQLETLNSEIFQFAAFVAETFTFDSTFPSHLPPDTLTGVEHLLGEQLFSLLRDHNEDIFEVMVQVCLQNALCCLAGGITRSWSVGDYPASDILAGVYNRIRLTGSSRVAGSWRAITRSAVHTAATFTPEQYSVIDLFATHLAPVLRVAGWAKSANEAYDTLMTEHHDKLNVIALASFKLNKLLGEQIISTDLDLVYIRGGEPFSSESMTDGFEASDGSQVVLGTTDLGLVQKKWPVEKGVESEEIILLKPKVALAGSFLD